MIDSTADLNFSEYNGIIVVGTHTSEIYGNGLKNKSAKEIIIPERYQGRKVIEIGERAFRETKIESVFIPRYVKTICHAAFWQCNKLKYVTFDARNKLETTDYDILGFTLVEFGETIQHKNPNIPFQFKINMPIIFRHY